MVRRLTQRKNLFIEVFTVNYTFSMWIKMSTHLPLSLSFSLSPHPYSQHVSFSVGRNHSYFIKLTDYGLPCPARPHLGLLFLQFLFGLAVSLLSLARWLHCYANCSQWLRLMVKCVKLHSKS